MAVNIKVLVTGIFGVIVVMLLISTSSPNNSDFLVGSAVDLAFLVVFGTIIIGVLGKLIKII